MTPARASLGSSEDQLVKMMGCRSPGLSPADSTPSRPLPPSCPTSGAERMKSQSDFPSLRGLAHTLRFVMASIPLPGGLRDSNSALCVYAPWSLPGGRVAGGQPWGCHRSRLASRGLGAPSLHPATFSELCPDLCWAGWPRWPQGLSSGGTQSSGRGRPALGT